MIKDKLNLSTSSRPGKPAAAGRPARGGQVMVEMMLILPVFLTIVFTIMEMGYIAFWVLMLNHATFEAARIGAMRAIDPQGNGPVVVTNICRTVMDRALPGARVESFAEATLSDPQPIPAQMNYDLVVTGTYDIKLVFPISSRMFSDNPGAGTRTVKAIVRMPIEQPQKG